MVKSLAHNRKAQVTVFIILGVIILFSAGLYSYLKLAGTGPSEIFQPKSPPVVAFIDACDMAIALITFSCGTDSAIKGVLAGIPNAKNVPWTRPTATSSANVMVSVMTSTAVMRARMPGAKGRIVFSAKFRKLLMHLVPKTLPTL